MSVTEDAFNKILLMSIIRILVDKALGWGYY